DGERALELFDRERFDVILMDVQMPRLDGFQTTQAVREREAATGAHVPIIAMTAHATEGDRESCLSSGMDDYMTKPVRGDELLRKIAEHVRPPGSPHAAP
ncbi:MAG: response regulator, partial [Pseudomonadota bacterium]